MKKSVSVRGVLFKEWMELNGDRLPVGGPEGLAVISEMWRAAFDAGREAERKRRNWKDYLRGDACP